MKILGLLILGCCLILPNAMASVSLSISSSNNCGSQSDSVSLENGQYDYSMILLPDEFFSQGGGKGGDLNEKSFFSRSKANSNERGRTSMSVLFSTESGTWSESDIAKNDEWAVINPAINFACKTGNGDHDIDIFNNYERISLDLASNGAEYIASSRITEDAIRYTGIGSFQGFGELSQEFLSEGAYGTDSKAIEIVGKGDVKNFISQTSFDSLKTSSSVKSLLSSNSDNSGWLDARVSINSKENSIRQDFNGNMIFDYSYAFQIGS
jgi:hypothetical protein